MIPEQINWTHADHKQITHFQVRGIPAPQGSKTRMPNGAMVEGSSTTGRIKLRDWRSAVASDAAYEAADPFGHGPWDEPVLIHVRFSFPVAKIRAKLCKHLGSLPMSRKPDLDKLLRSTGDALVIGGLILRDELITAWVADKVEVPEGEFVGAVITICEYGL